MSGVAMHWAAAYLGKPWRRGARGPHAYCCWGLVQALCEARLGVAMPEVAVGTEQAQFGAILEASRGQGWQQVSSGPPAADDIVVMRKRDGDRHCGYLVHADGALGVLHADGSDAGGTAAGEVVFESLAAACHSGYRGFEFWRRT